MNDGGRTLNSFQRKQLEHKLKQHDMPKLLRQRIEIMLLADEGKTQREICQILGCSVATVNRWVLFAHAQFVHQWQDSPPGRPKKVSNEYIQRLQELVQSPPRDYGYPFYRWTTNWLNKHLTKELGIELRDRHLGRLLKQLGLSTCAKEPEPWLTKTARINSCNIEHSSESISRADLSNSPPLRLLSG